MKDYLMEFCSSLNIKVVYIDSEKILYCGFEDNVPVIYVHKIFKSCPQKIVNAVIDYCLRFKNQEKNSEIIQEYVNDLLNLSQYEIAHPNERFKRFITKYVLTTEQESQPIPKATQKPKTQELDDASTMYEMNISSIRKKDFWGNETDISPDDCITASSDNVIELDIVVDDFDT